MIGDLKIVEFDKYCDTCKYKKRSEKFKKCNDCLTIAARQDSHKPEYYEEDKK